MRSIRVGDMLRLQTQIASGGGLKTNLFLPEDPLVTIDWLLAERRARDSNPQPVNRHLISNQTPNHSDTLRLYV